MILSWGNPLTTLPPHNHLELESFCSSLEPYHQDPLFVSRGLFYLPYCLQNFVRQTMEGIQKQDSRRRQPAALDNHEKHPETLFIFIITTCPNAKFEIPVCFRTKHTHMDQRTLTWVFFFFFTGGKRRQLGSKGSALAMGTI